MKFIKQFVMFLAHTLSESRESTLWTSGVCAKLHRKYVAKSYKKCFTKANSAFTSLNILQGSKQSLIYFIGKHFHCSRSLANEQQLKIEKYECSGKTKKKVYLPDYFE